VDLIPGGRLELVHHEVAGPAHLGLAPHLEEPQHQLGLLNAGFRHR